MEIISGFSTGPNGEGSSKRLMGIAFNAGLGYRQTVGGADNDTATTSFAAADSAVNISYQVLS